MKIINTANRELTTAEKSWLSKFRKMAQTAPKGIELIITRSGKIDIYTSGAVKKHIGSKNDCWGLDSNPDIEGMKITSISFPIVYPYSECE